MGLNKPQERHRPSALKQQNKAHKHGRHKSKGVLDNETKGNFITSTCMFSCDVLFVFILCRFTSGKISVKSLTKRNKKLLGKEERRNQAGQVRKKKRDEVLLKKRSIGGAKTAPFLVSTSSSSLSLKTVY